MDAVGSSDEGRGGKEEEKREEYHLVASLQELKQSGRMRVRVGGEGGRVLALFHVDSQVHALDHFCYRKQHPLTYPHAPLPHVGVAFLLQMLAGHCPWGTLRMCTGGCVWCAPGTSTA